MIRVAQIKLLITFLLISGLLVSCGHKVKRSELNADEYFAYAKSLLDRGKCFSAITEFTAMTLKYAGDPIMDDAQFYLAESYFCNKEYLIAVSEYQKLTNDFPNSPYVQEAFYKIGLSYYKLSLRPELDQEYTDLALRQFQNFIEAFPNSKFRQQAEEKIFELRTKKAKKLLLGGDTYRKMGIYDSAIIYYDILLEKYYDTPPAEMALFWKAECQYRLKKYNEAITTFTVFTEKFKKSKRYRAAINRIKKIQGILNEIEASNSKQHKG